MSYQYLGVNDPVRKEIYERILKRLEDKSSHDYQWPRWAAADEASYEIMGWLLDKELIEPPLELIEPPKEEPPLVRELRKAGKQSRERPFWTKRRINRRDQP